MPSLELPDYARMPFMQPNSCVQVSCGANEVCTNRFGADQLSFYCYGPQLQAGISGSFSIQQLVRRVDPADALETDAVAVTLGRPKAQRCRTPRRPVASAS